MATYYLDYAGGGDNSHTALSFSERVKDWTKITPSPGDTVRLMASPEPTLLGTVGFTNASGTISLPSAVTAAIGDHADAWTASSNVTANAYSTFSELILGYKTQLDIDGAFTTGKLAYRAISSLDLSTYQQVSLWYQATGATGGLELRLCTDTAGATAAHTIPLPSVSDTLWHPLVLDFGTNLNSAIQSIALYATSDPGAITVALNNLVACKASSADDSLTHNSLVAKISALPWQASTAYTMGDVRKPTVGNRNGRGYICTSSGTSGSTEPPWTDNLGDSFNDGTASWECHDLEEPWLAIVNFDGTTVTLEETNYPGTTESITAYKREPIVLSPTVAQPGCTSDGTPSLPITLSGGWNTTDMSTQTGETWVAARNMPVWVLRRANISTTVDDENNMRGLKCWNVSNLHARRHARGINPWSAVMGLNDVSLGGALYGLNAVKEFASSQTTSITFNAVKFQGCMHPLRWEGADIDMDKCDLLSGRFPDPVGYPSNAGNVDCYPAGDKSSIDDSGNWVANVRRTRLRGIEFRLRGGGEHMFSECDLDKDNYSNIVSTGNATLLRCLNAFDDSQYQTWAARTRGRVRAQDCTGGPGDTVIDLEGTARIVTDTTTTHSAGQSWNYMTTDPWGSIYEVPPYAPMKLVVGKLYVQAAAPVNVSIWARRDSTSSTARLVVRGGQLPGVAKQIIDITPSALDTWEQSGTVSITPDVDGVVEVEVWFDNIEDPDYIVRNFWVDDLTVV